METTLTVKSDTNPDLEYRVVIQDTGTGSCECMSWRFSPSPKTCKHLKRLIDAGVVVPVPHANLVSQGYVDAIAGHPQKFTGDSSQAKSYLEGWKLGLFDLEAAE